MHQTTGVSVRHRLEHLVGVNRCSMTVEREGEPAVVIFTCKQCGKRTVFRLGLPGVVAGRRPAVR